PSTYKSMAEAKVTDPYWLPAALEMMTSSKADPFAVCARGVYGTPALLPGVTEPGAGDVSRAANTSSPARTAPVAPVSTLAPSGARAGTIWSSEPASATPEYSATVPSRNAA